MGQAEVLLSKRPITANGATDVQEYQPYKGAIFIFNVTDVTGESVIIDFALEFRDSASGEWVPVGRLFKYDNEAPEPLVYIRAYGGDSSATVPFLPGSFRIPYTVAGTDPSATVSIGVNWLT